MITLEVTDQPDHTWNNRLLNSPYGTIYHTKEHASMLEWLGRKPYFIKFLDNKGHIVAQMLGTVYSRSGTKSISSLIKKVSGKNKLYFSWTFGPVFFETELYDEICKSFSDFILSKNFLPVGSSHPLTGRPFTKINSQLRPEEWCTFLIDLSENQDEIWNKMEKHSARKNISRAEKHNVSVKQMTKKDLPLYQKIREETKPVTLEVLEKRWDLLKSIGWTGFLAFRDDIVIGGLMISYFNKYVNEWGIARTLKDTKEKTYAQDLLKWNVIKWGIENNFNFFDLTGANPNASDDKEKGIFKYKKKWGGELIKYDMIKP